MTGFEKLGADVFVSAPSFVFCLLLYRGLTIYIYIYI